MPNARGDAPGPSALKKAASAVFRPSVAIPGNARPVEGIDFNRYTENAVTVEEMIGGMATMGFQASATADAVRVINKMVCCSHSHTRLAGAAQHQALADAAQ